MGEQACPCYVGECKANVSVVKEKFKKNGNFHVIFYVLMRTKFKTISKPNTTSIGLNGLVAASL